MSQRNCKILTLIHPAWWARKGPIGAINVGIVKSPKLSYKGRTQARIDTPLKPLVNSKSLNAKKSPVWSSRSYFIQVLLCPKVCKISKGFLSLLISRKFIPFLGCKLPKWIFQSAGVFNIILDHLTKCGCQGPPPKHAAAFLGLVPPGKRVGIVTDVWVFTPNLWFDLLFLVLLVCLGFLFLISLCLLASLRLRGSCFLGARLFLASLRLRGSCFLGASLYPSFSFGGSFSLGLPTFSLWGNLLCGFCFSGAGCRFLLRTQGILQSLLLASVHLRLQGWIFSKAIGVFCGVLPNKNCCELDFKCCELSTFQKRSW